MSTLSYRQRSEDYIDLQYIKTKRIVHLKKEISKNLKGRLNPNYIMTNKQTKEGFELIKNIKLMHNK